jgi:hypothetical protein
MKKKKLSRHLRQVYDACARIGVFENSEYGYYLRSFPAEVRDILRGDPPRRRGLPTLDEIKQVIAWSDMRTPREIEFLRRLAKRKREAR